MCRQHENSLWLRQHENSLWLRQHENTTKKALLNAVPFRCFIEVLERNFLKNDSTIPRAVRDGTANGSGADEE